MPPVLIAFLIAVALIVLLLLVFAFIDWSIDKLQTFDDLDDFIAQLEEEARQSPPPAPHHHALTHHPRPSALRHPRQ